MSILIVDDEESIRTYVDRVLSKAGYQTTLAVDGSDCDWSRRRRRPIRSAADRRHDARHDGRRARPAVAPGPIRLKVLYLTGYADQLFTEKVTLWEDEAFLEKPCSAAALLQAVSLAITGRIGAGRIG